MARLDEQAGARAHALYAWQRRVAWVDRWAGAGRRRARRLQQAAFSAVLAAVSEIR